MSKKRISNLILKVKDVEASLTRGQIYSGKIWLSLIILIFIFAVLSIISGTILLILDSGELIIGIGTIICSAFSIFVDIFIYCITIRKNKKISVWLKDSVILEANCVSLGNKLVTRFPIPMAFQAAAIQIVFVYNGECYERQSKYKGELAYLKVFNKYANQKNMIAYSPKYDEVMLLKKV